MASEPTKEELLFGRIALHNKLITQAQLDEAVAARRRRTDVNDDLGRILKSQGAVDDKQYRTIRKAQEKALLAKGVTEEQAKYLARGMNADGTEPGGDAPARRPTASFEPPAAEPEEMDDPEVVEDEEPAPAPAAAPVTSGDDHDHDDDRPRAAVKRPVDPSARKTMVSLLKKARDSGASDLHLSCGAKPFMRLHGQIHYLNMPVITPEQGEALAAGLMSDAGWAHFQKTNDWDGSVEAPECGRFRANVLRNRRGISGVYRVIKEKIPTLQELGLPESLEKFTTFHQGLCLVTGAAGSGKSSTLAALIDIVNQNRKDHIITMEDPIEYVFQGKGCNVSQRQIELHTKSWGNALRASLREDPDVIMIGEMRDLDTVRLAITASETGHLVFGTLHTTSATRTMDRLLDVFPPGEQSQIRAMVSESLKGVISQRLLPRADGKGRVAALEILGWTPAVANIIREGTTYKLLSVLQTGRKLGMILMDESIKKLLDEGVITKEVARASATNPKLFQ
ncbi:MAG: PilT/PilU family type 4a pilus ATPase [Planctomycetes bacterium]|nr:PilT/PilU family type 4a pilus ATPase [Planctomycetota bacterium]